MIKKICFLVLYFISPALPIVAIYSSNPGYYSSAGFIPMVLGSMAFTWLNMQLILSARPKRIESSFGLDRFYQFHSLMAVIAIVIAFTHKLLQERTFSESFQTKLGDAAIVIFIIASVLALVFMIDTLVRIIKPLQALRVFAQKMNLGKYNMHVILHNLNVVAVVLVFIHVMLSYSASNPFVKAVYILYSGTAIGFYLYHKVIRRYFLNRKFVVEQVHAESSSISTLILRPEVGEVFPYLPGQFGFLRILSDGISAEEHPFSISSQPSDKKHISVTVKSLGDWTVGVRNIKAGSKATLDAPYGRFSPLKYDCENGIVLIAGGVGITPMLSIVRYFYQNDKSQKLMLFWGVNDQKEIICGSEFQAFQEEMQNFTFIPVLAKDESYEGEKGYVTEEKLEKYINLNGYNLQELQYFICGPAVMQTSILKSLKLMGVNNKNIHYERFSL